MRTTLFGVALGGPFFWEGHMVIARDALKTGRKEARGTFCHVAHRARHLPHEQKNSLCSLFLLGSVLFLGGVESP